MKPIECSTALHRLYGRTAQFLVLILSLTLKLYFAIFPIDSVSLWPGGSVHLADF